MSVAVLKHPPTLTLSRSISMNIYTDILSENLSRSKYLTTYINIVLAARSRASTRVNAKNILGYTEKQTYDILRNLPQKSFNQGIFNSYSKNER
jgi:hypothetical protein